MLASVKPAPDAPVEPRPRRFSPERRRRIQDEPPRRESSEEPNLAVSAASLVVGPSWPAAPDARRRPARDPSPTPPALSGPGRRAGARPWRRPVGDPPESDARRGEAFWRGRGENPRRRGRTRAPSARTRRRIAAATPAREKPRTPRGGRPPADDGAPRPRPRSEFAGRGAGSRRARPRRRLSPRTRRDRRASLTDAVSIINRSERSKARNSSAEDHRRCERTGG